MHHSLLPIYLKSVFTPVVFSPFKWNSAVFSDLVRFVCGGVNTVNTVWTKITAPTSFGQAGLGTVPKNPSRAVCLMSEDALTPIRANYHVSQV